MRLLMPPTTVRRQIDAALANFFETHQESFFHEAVKLLCGFYRCRAPRVVWWERLPNPKDAGNTFEDGTVHLTHPEDWKKNRKYNKPKRWRRIFYHEFWHYYSWADNERKANIYESRFVQGL